MSNTIIPPNKKLQKISENKLSEIVTKLDMGLGMSMISEIFLCLVEIIALP